MHKTDLSLSLALPWHQPIWQQILQQRQQQRLPHALLLQGASGMGKALFAKQLAHSLLCQNSDPNTGLACGQCSACHLVDAGYHPDFYPLRGEGKSQQIRIETTRTLQNLVSLTPSYDGYQVILIDPAEAMNRNTANSLLKLLEEPPPSCCFILVNQQPARLLPTIKSRCQKLQFVMPSTLESETQAWLDQQLPAEADRDLLLKLSANAPLLALDHWQNWQIRAQVFQGIVALLQQKVDPIQQAELWLKQDESVLMVFYWSLQWLMDAIRYCVAGGALNNLDQAPTLQQIAPLLQTKSSSLFRFLDQHLIYYQQLQSNSSVRPQSLLEQVSLIWYKLTMETV